MKFRRSILNSIVCGLLFSASLTQASDLDIYASAGSGKTVITLMLDTSGSMFQYRDVRIPGLRPGRTVTVGYTDPNNSSKNITRRLRLEGDSGSGNLTRMTVLKYSLINLLANPNKISDDKIIGLGHFNQGGRRKHNGVIDYPARPLTKSHREALIDIIMNLRPRSVTPTAAAYAETAAYMLGSTTYLRGYGGYSGTFYSNSLTKDRSPYKYKSPIANVKSCDGYGIYFLTDGVPSQYRTWHLEDVMQKTLENTDKSLSCSGNNWNCIRNLSKALRNIKLDGSSTEAAVDIKTAVVGYGKAFLSTKNRIKIGNVSDDFPEQDTYADCDSVRGNDERNACLWGSKPFKLDPKKQAAGFYRGYAAQIAKIRNNGGYGEGGFYYAENADDVAFSVLKFIEELGGEVEPISTGTFSVPLDPLNSNSARASAYLPMMVPNVGSKNLWLGNLKKYTIQDGTIKGNLNASQTKAVIFDANGSFTKDTYDMWSVARTADEGDTMKGGVFGRIFSTANANATPPTYHKNRNIFVNKTDTVLKKLTIDDAKKPENFDELSSDINDDMKRSIANFMGYPVSTQNIKDGEVITKDFSASHKVHGAVLHSKPVLITKSARIDTNNNETRDDYVLYGSFDGALHIVDDETGVEKFTFLPKEVIKEQHKYLVKGDKSAQTRQFYGVDAPWAVYSDYSVDINPTTKDTLIEPKQIFAFGGLRMGGSKYYALDLTNLDSASRDPSLLFTIGSEYGASENAVTSTGNYARMGQTWAKPTIIYLKESKNQTIGGSSRKIPVKKMVGVFPGGYDMKYEDPNYSSSLTDASSDLPLGNAIYMVEVGKIERNSNNESFVNTATAGTLLKTLTKTANNNVSNKPNGNKYMINSIVSQVRAIDSDYDGYTDHLYFSDLGGQVFRVDIDNSGDESKIVEVVRLFSAENQRGTKNVGGNSIKDSKPRFYETPLVTFEKRESDNEIVGIITVASGNRSKPLYKRANKDKIYTFLDKDISNTNANFTNRNGTTSSYRLKTHNLSMNNLQKLSFRYNNSGRGIENAPSGSGTIKNKMDSNQIEGWYFELENWENNNTTVEGIKVFNSLNALNGYLYYTSFNPNVSTSSNSCSAQIKGATQRESLCLPYGSCKAKDSSGNDINVKYETIYAGRGNVENTLGFMKLRKEYDSNNNCIKNCDIDTHEIGIIGNAPGSCTKPNNPNFNPITACVSVNKKLFPLNWKSSD